MSSELKAILLGVTVGVATTKLFDALSLSEMIISSLICVVVGIWYYLSGKSDPHQM